jgi:two-component sensor histidine kinase
MTRVHVWHVPNDVRSAGLVRREISALVLLTTQDSDLADAAAMVVNELVTNAVLHATSAATHHTIDDDPGPGADAGDKIRIELTLRTNAEPTPRTPAAAGAIAPVAPPDTLTPAAPSDADAPSPFAAGADLASPVRIEVRDSSNARPRARPGSGTATTGRGVALVAALCARWGVDDLNPGKSVWAELQPTTTAPPGTTPATVPAVPAVPAASGGPSAVPTGRPAVAGPNEAAIGRYQTSEPGARHTRVRLLAVPVQVWARAVEWHDDLMREAALLTTGVGAGALDAHALPAQLLALVTELRARYRTDSARSDRTREAALAAGLDSVDLQYVVPNTLADTLPALQALFDGLQDYCAADNSPLLTLPPDDTIRRFQHWYLTEIISQIRGAAPNPWPHNQRDSRSP